ncbi:hypothetical protein CIB84_003455 [Bambusicola thoracicus]|uniref:DUF4549 domain-containing protein n=1 Tax=Bambusicola thoracicus TaxID=9083 RepID=A0A2P4T8W4_BAMTH|nr:hypothetical protein CIB84_003455 [Bambusicola thoracicus]
MLRWKRFCTHSSVIEQLYPLYQVGSQTQHLMHSVAVNGKTVFFTANKS